MTYVKVTKDKEKIKQWVDWHISTNYPSLHMNRSNYPNNNAFEMGVEFIEELMDTSNFIEMLEKGVIEIVS